VAPLDLITHSTLGRRTAELRNFQTPTSLHICNGLVGSLQGPYIERKHVHALHSYLSAFDGVLDGVFGLRSYGFDLRLAGLSIMVLLRVVVSMSGREMM